MRFYRDVNSKFVKEKQGNGLNWWWVTSPHLTFAAVSFKIEDGGRDFHVENFMKNLYKTIGYQSWYNGKYKVIGNSGQRIFNGRTQPLIQHNGSVEIKRNEPFYINVTPEKKENKFISQF